MRLNQNNYIFIIFIPLLCGSNLFCVQIKKYFTTRNNANLDHIQFFLVLSVHTVTHII